MSLPTSHSLEVPGARLYYEVQGSGPALMLVGHPMGASGFAPIAPLLAEAYTVVTFDPRGFARSTIDDPDQDAEPDLLADDVRRVLEAVGEVPARVFGSSGGAVTGLALVAHYPGHVETLIAHEPPLALLLPEAEEGRAGIHEIYDTYRDSGITAAWELVVVFSAGGLMEDYVADRARSSIRGLMSLSPVVAARLRPDSTTEQVTVDDLQPGELVLVRPGERLPTDGQVTAGSSWIDQSPVTGESIPAEASEGSQVFGGTLNGAGTLTVQVTKPYRDTVLARVIEQVEQAQARRGSAQRFADRFGAVYTPIMFALAALIAAGGPAVGLSRREAVYRGLVILVVSCSCALVISVPTAVIAAISRSARDGILIKGGIHLETLAKVRAVAFDKTGTLTAGKPRLTDVIPLDSRPPDQVLGACRRGRSR